MVQIDPPDVFLGEEKFIFKGEICENLSLKPTLSTECRVSCCRCLFKLAC